MMTGGAEYWMCAKGVFCSFLPPIPQVVGMLCRLEEDVGRKLQE